MPLPSWIDLTAGLLHTSSLLLSFFCTNVSSLDHMLLSCHFSISAKYKYDRSIACCFFGWFLTRAVRGGAGRILWVEQLWNVHPRKLDREIFEDGPSAKIGSLENFRPYGITILPTLPALPLSLPSPMAIIITNFTNLQHQYY